MTTKHQIFKLNLKGLWHQYRFENKVWVLGPLCDHLIGRNSISKSAASKSYKTIKYPFSQLKEQPNQFFRVRMVHKPDMPFPVSFSASPSFQKPFYTDA